MTASTIDAQDQVSRPIRSRQGPPDPSSGRGVSALAMTVSVQGVATSVSTVRVASVSLERS